jgi:hypothetical protein
MSETLREIIRYFQDSKSEGGQVWLHPVLEGVSTENPEVATEWREQYIHTAEEGASKDPN